MHLLQKVLLSFVIMYCCHSLIHSVTKEHQVILCYLLGIQTLEHSSMDTLEVDNQVENKILTSPLG